jgi:hypothetical protein
MEVRLRCNTADLAANLRREAVEEEVQEEVRTKRRPFRTLFLLDVFSDPDSRPALLYAVSALLVGMFVYHYLEGWSYLDAFYFCVITLATVGYGDLTPTTPAAKIFTVIYVFNGIAILLTLFDRIRVLRSARAQERRRQKKTNGG